MKRLHFSINEDEWDDMSSTLRLKSLSDFCQSLLKEFDHDVYGIQRFRIEQLLDENTNLSPDILEVYLDFVFTNKDYATCEDFDALTQKAMRFEFKEHQKTAY